MSFFFFFSTEQEKSLSPAVSVSSAAFLLYFFFFVLIGHFPPSYQSPLNLDQLDVSWVKATRAQDRKRRKDEKKGVACGLWPHKGIVKTICLTTKAAVFGKTKYIDMVLTGFLLL